MRFLVDAQLPPVLALWLMDRGHEAQHVRDLGLERDPDEKIVAYATARDATIITKDADFSRFASAKPRCAVVWLRFGNATSRDLLKVLEPIFAEVEDALASGQHFVEIGR